MPSHTSRPVLHANNRCTLAVNLSQHASAMPTDGIAEPDSVPRKQEPMRPCPRASYHRTKTEEQQRHCRRFFSSGSPSPLLRTSSPTTITENHQEEGRAGGRRHPRLLADTCLTYHHGSCLPWRRGSRWCSGARAPVFSPRGQDGAVRCRSARWRRQGEEETRDWGREGARASPTCTANTPALHQPASAAGQA